jgi:predicted ATPase
MIVRWVETGRTELRLGTEGKVRSHKIDVLTGPNGSGKTDILAALASIDAGMTHSQKTKMGFKMAKVLRDTPTRTIVQTFSPFTRFAAPLIEWKSLSKIYTQGEYRDEKYVCIGLHRSYAGIGRNVSRRVLEEALFRLSESPEATKVLLGILYDLGFSGGFKLGYQVSLRGEDIFALLKNAEQPEQILSSLLQSSPPGARSGVLGRLRREVDEIGIREFSVRLRDAFQVILPYLNHNLKKNALVFKVELERIRHEFYVLQALAFLRRLEFLSLTECEIFRPKSDEGIDVADTSSGQQQLLCTLFGLATAIKSGSLVLIDEPELSLHPQWQSDFARNLDSILEHVSDCHVIIATHSPLIVQSLQALGAAIAQMGSHENPSDMLTSDQHAISSVEQTLVDVFNLPVAASAHVSNEIFNAVVDGEAGDGSSKIAALIRLNSLQNLYQTPGADGETLEMIKDAIRLIEEPQQEPPYRLSKARRRH